MLPSLYQNTFNTFTIKVFYSVGMIILGEEFFFTLAKKLTSMYIELPVLLLSRYRTSIAQD